MLNSVTLEPLAPCYAATPEQDWNLETDEDRAELKARWDPILGDRQIEIVFIGIDMNEADLRHRLDSCLLTKQEFEQGPNRWVSYPDPLPQWYLSCDPEP